MGSDRERAFEVVETFQQRKAPGWFTSITRAEAAESIRRKIANPVNVNQGDTYNCGPAAFIYAMAKDHPKKYADVATELYDDGVCYITDVRDWRTGMWIRPGSHLKDYRPDPTLVEIADWIVMASLRDSKNWFLDVESTADSNWTSGTRPWELTRWLRLAGGYDSVVNNTFWLTPFSKENHLREAARYFREKHRVFLSVHGAILRLKPSTWSVWPNHWVVLESDILIGDNIQMSVYSWGEKTNNKITKKGDFLDHYYGFIAAKY